ncbi:MAG: type II toxin-antitoxin system VapC family toxin [Candidatus Cyclonatronum sp.]|uniref:type II toxin-antitoxin system VapC family toxin n=1 Tax=Cyclonatronum sp. TaxID=3024185 RepID=UPI0025C0CF22|nr:type II toxin-antitoxin system VapC family toxin [Cyclonatronum sp.]MCH8487900.1 type II toxin-antitoxin system VapC family toxin [Cyclonatronum sp.]
MIVVDNNILAHFWLPSEHSMHCEELFRWDPEWVAPVLWKSEFRNVITLYLRKNLIDLPDAIRITEKAAMQMQEREFHVNSVQVYSLAVKSGCSAYDCEFVSLAEELDVKLITFDKQILRAFPNRAAKPTDALPRPPA